MNKLEKLPDDQINSLIATERLVLQYDTTGQRVAVGLPFALECHEDNWWICCPEGRFQLRVDLPVLWSRQHSAEDAKWVSVLDFFWGVVAYEGQTEKPLDIELPSSVEPRHADWLLRFVRECMLVQVAEDQMIPTEPPQNRTTLPKPGVYSPGRTRVRVRRYHSPRRQWGR